MSDRSKNILATVAVIGIAAIASSQLEAGPSPRAPQAAPSAAAPLVMASLTR